MKSALALTAFILSGQAQEADNHLCENMQPICSDEILQFIALDTVYTAEAGNNYGCLWSQPDPTWYYLRISDDSPANSNLYMDLTASADIDFIIYGPFATLADAKAQCGSLGTGNPSNNVVEDCSYSATNAETPAITGCNPGEYYVMLVTNYAQQQQPVTLQTSTTLTSTARTDCGMVPVCTDVGLSLSTPHYCTCQSRCTGGYCNTLAFVENRLGLPVTTDTDLLCPDDTMDTCCCSCQNCDPYVPVV